jgi:hypothetical protein
MSKPGPAGDNAEASNIGGAMRIFIFKSDASPDLRAFGGDMVGARLPTQFSPWHVIGAVAPDRNPPHNLSRAAIETAIKHQGFQLWRLSKKMKD